MKGRGVVYVALGRKAQIEAGLSILGLLEHNRMLNHVITEPPNGLPDLTTEQQAHWAKVNMDKLSPYDSTLMLDADTRIHGKLELGFKLLQKGWDIVMVPSTLPSSKDILWNLSSTERDYTFQALGTWRHIMLNTGVFYFKKNNRTKALFELWRQEWLRFKDRDQGAFLRALRHRPVFMWLLGHPYNGLKGEVVEHLFGRCVA